MSVSRATKRPGQEERRIEVVLSRGDDGRREILLQDMSYGSGVGWYVQKTLRLEPEHVDAVLKSLCCVRGQCRQGTSEGKSGARIIQLSDPVTRA